MNFFTEEECQTFANELKENKGMSPKAEEILQKLKALSGDVLAQVKANNELSTAVGGAAKIVSDALVTAVQHVADNDAPEEVRAQVLEIVTIEFMTAQMHHATPETGPINMWLSTEESEKGSQIRGLYWHNEDKAA